MHAGYRVYYTTAAELVARTSRAAIDGRWANTMRFWAGPQLLIIDLCRYRDYADIAAACSLSGPDRLGFLPVSPAGLSA
ncbi:MAG: ATP-binding protein [Trebonia sp.]